MVEVLQPTDDRERALDPGGEPPVVARMVVEIRSDGTRTIARGALEDAATGQRVALHAEGTTPAALAASLARSLWTLPVLHNGRDAVRRVVRRLLPPQRR